MMEHNPLYWQAELFLRWEEGQTLADMLASFDAQPPLDERSGSPLHPGAPPEVVAETIRRLTAVFYEQVDRVAHRLGAACCALYLVEPAQGEGVLATRHRRAGKEARAADGSARPSPMLRALYGASWGQESARLGMATTPGGPVMQAILEQKPIQSEQADPPLLQEWAKTQQVRRWLYVPIFGRPALWPAATGGRPAMQNGFARAYTDQPEPPRLPLGVLAVGRRLDAQPFTDADKRLLGEHGEYLALALEYLRLGEQVEVARELGKRYQEMVQYVAERERIIQELDEGVLLLTPGGYIVHLNAKGRELLGWPESVRSAAAPDRVQDFVPVEMHTAAGNILLLEDWPMFRALHGERFTDEQLLYRGPDGHEHLLVFSGRPLYDARGKLEYALLSFHQASSEEAARAELEQIARVADQRSLYVSSVLESMTDSLLVCDQRGYLLLVNPAGIRMLGIGRQLVLSGQYHVARLVADFQVRTLNGHPLAVDDFPLMRAMQGETVHDVQLTLRRPDTGYEWQAHVSASPVRARREGDPTVGAVAVLVDMSSARALDRAKDEFLAVSAHELKGPLTSIRGFAQLLRRGTKQAPDGVERRTDMQWVEKIEAQADRLGKLIEELTDAARADLGKFDLKVREVPLCTLLRRVAEAQQVTTSRHKIIVDAPASGLFVQGDETRLEQVFSNLVANAIKYSPGGGEVTILAPSVEEAATAQMVEVSVRDQGQGISSADLERIFTRFTRGDAVRGVQGLGLGLYIARAIIDAHGGTIRAESPGLGQGSTFVVSLPREIPA